MRKKAVELKEKKSFEKIIRIIFPEIQVIDKIKMEGFIDKTVVFKKYRSISNNIAKSEIKEKVSSSLDNLYSKGTEVSTEVPLGTSDVTNYSKKAVSENFKTKTENKNLIDIDGKFDFIEAELNKYVLSQQEYIKGLSLAFKRSFLLKKTDGIKNIIFISGTSGTGRHLSVKVIGKLLKDAGLIRNGHFNSIDLTKYTLEKHIEDLFIPDLYRCFYENGDIVLFDDIDSAIPSIIEVISRIGIDEKIQVNKRYKEQLGSMSDITGNLTVNATDEIDVNGKYFIFITEKNEREILSMFSSRFNEKVYDILTTNRLDSNAINTITHFELEDCLKNIKHDLNLIVEASYDIEKIVVDNFQKDQGAHGIKEYIENNIYKPLVQLKLKENPITNNIYSIKYIEKEFVLDCGANKYGLSNYINKKNMDISLSEIKKELSNIIGLNSVKDFVLGLEQNMKMQELRRGHGEKSSKISLHTIFTGNPGTGKTTIARIVAKYLKYLGYLSSGHLIEVSRNDLIGQYLGHTAEKTMNKINSAKGGVLFIDEAYSLVRDENDPFGKEAIDTLVKAMEDYRDDLVVILAGYVDEMNMFLKTNPGLKSRFNNIIEFKDYTTEELVEITKVISRSKGYSIHEDAYSDLYDLYNRKQIKGKNDSGNGRLVRNVVEKAITSQAVRLSKLDTKDITKEQLGSLTIEDFGVVEKVEYNLENHLSEIIGLDEVKEFLREIQVQMKVNKKRKELGVTIDSSQTLNMIFTGNPGTGKTTVARIVAEVMNGMGYLKSSEVVEVDRTELIGQHIGETTKKVQEIFMSALGGILFIDEAYSLFSGDNDPYGREAVDTLVKLIEDHREDIIVIMAGYSKEMSKFLQSNSGLKSRFPLSINFADYSEEELFMIGKAMLDSKGFVIDSQAEEAFKKSIRLQKKKFGVDGGNGRLVRNIIEKTIRRQNTRIIKLEEIDNENIKTLLAEDFYSDENFMVSSFNLEKELNKVIGLEDVKDFIRSLEAQIKIRNARKAANLSYDEGQTLHMIFKGNPGTGKTTMARIIGGILNNLGVLPTNKFVETDRSGLVAGYVGQTAMKTREVMESAIGGILFIDEAYSLWQNGNKGSDFGKEAIDTLVKKMDDNRENLVVILAGYSDDMDEFLEVNPGLKSRFANIIEFNDYSVDELLKIAKCIYDSKGYILTEGAEVKMKTIFEKIINISDFGNGRYVRNLYEKSIRNQAVRLSSDNDLTKEELIAIIEQDITEV